MDSIERDAAQQVGVFDRGLAFLILCFALSWSAGWFAWLQRENATLALPATLVMSSGPGLAALFCASLFDSGRRLTVLGLRGIPNRWWLFAYAMAIAFCLAVGVATVFAGRQQLVAPSISFAFVLSLLAINPLVQTAMATFMEEIGWRGYLYEKWRHVGFWRFSVGTGFIWGIWHLPGLMLLGFNYPQHPYIGAAIFVPYCMLLAPLVTLVRDRAGSAVAAGILHGTINAIAVGMMMMFPDSPPLWNGATGLGVVAGLAVAITTVLLIRPRPSNNALHLAHDGPPK